MADDDVGAFLRSQGIAEGGLTPGAAESFRAPTLQSGSTFDTQGFMNWYTGLPADHQNAIQQAIAPSSATTATSAADASNGPGVLPSSEFVGPLLSGGGPGPGPAIPAGGPGVLPSSEFVGPLLSGGGPGPGDIPSGGPPPSMSLSDFLSQQLNAAPGAGGGPTGGGPGSTGFGSLTENGSPGSPPATSAPAVGSEAAAPVSNPQLLRPMNPFFIQTGLGGSVGM